MPFVWSLQEALMTAELGTAFPEESGGVAWVETAFGQMAGWMAGYLGWIAGATDNAIYVSDAVIDGTCISQRESHNTFLYSQCSFSIIFFSILTTTARKSIRFFGSAFLR
jgi:amino acid transporter